MNQLLNKLLVDYPAVSFVKNSGFMWSPSTRTVNYKTGSKPHHSWKLLHELGHAQLNHSDYNSDIELLEIEAEAWQEAENIAANYNLSISDDFIQDCLDTYRDWLFKRSQCPRCSSICFQKDTKHYNCFNCLHVWTVTNQQLCRPYRRSLPSGGAVAIIA